ncbi:MAG: Ig-like domain-containing protein [Clostridia bacterium]|nr:Ig-like domain-containing protein [Clostridia bacterium]
MKKILSIVLAVAMVFGISFVAVPAHPALAASDASISADGSHCIGDTFTITVTAPNAGKGEKWDASFTLENANLIDSSTAPDPADFNPMSAGSSKTTTCKAIASGKIKFTVTFTLNSESSGEDVSGVKTTKSASYEIKQPELNVSPSEVTYSPSATATASVSYLPEASSGSFASSDGNVATIDNHGNIIVQGAGQTTISYTDGTLVLSKVFTVKKATVALSVQDEITLHKDDVRNIPLNKSGIPSTMYSEITIINSSPSIATADPNSTYSSLKITALEVGTTVATISFPSSSDDYQPVSTKIKINVIDENTPILTLNPTSMSLHKGDAKALTVSVDNSSNNNVLLKVTGSKSNSYRGVAIDGYTSKNGVYVLVNGSNSVTLTPKYNGTYYVTASLNGAEARCVVTVTGCNTLPQTGPDFTLVYVFAGLLLASLMVLAYVNIKRKKAVQ